MKGIMLIEMVMKFDEKCIGEIRVVDILIRNIDKIQIEKVS